MSKSEIEIEALYPLIEEVIASGGEFRLYPKGTSMLPLIRQGIDSVVLVSAQDVAENDIVFYKRDNGQFVLHRLVKTKGEEYVMCGDIQNELEYGIRKEQILAKVAYCYKEDKRVSFDTKEYKKYVKSLPRMRRKRKIKAFLSSVKHKIFK